jgi:hypothetical protein
LIDPPSANEGRGWRRTDRVAAAAITVAVAVLFLGVLIGQQHLWGDFVTWYFPSHEYAIERIRHGALPLWNPYLDCGMPFLGEADHGTLYPPSLLLLPFAGDRHLFFRALEFFTLLHLVGAGLALHALLRFLGCRPTAALTGGIVFALGGVFVARSAQLSLVTAQAWLPVVLKGAFQTLQARPEARRRGALAVALGVGMIGLSGSPSTLTIAAVGLAVLTVTAAAVAARARDWRPAVAGTAVAVLAALLGLGLSGAQIAPMFEFVKASERMAYTYAEVAAFSLEPDNLVMLLLPRFNGWLAYDEPSYWGSGNFSEVSGYTGLLSLALVALALRFRPMRETIPWAVLALFGLWLALGPHGGLQWLLFRYLPWIGMMRAPGRYLVLWALGISVLAGLGVEATFERRDEVRRWSAVLLAAVLGLTATVALAAPALLRSLEPWKQPWFRAGIGYMLPASATAALGLLLMARARTTGPALGGMVALAAAAELVIQGTGIGVVAQEERIQKLLQPGAYEQLFRRDPGLFRVQDLYGEQSRLMLARLQGVSGPGRHLLDYELYRTRVPSQYSATFDLLNIKYLLAFESTPGTGRSPNVLAHPYVWLSRGEEAVLPIDPPLLARGVDVVSTVSGSWELEPGVAVAEIVLLGTQGETRTVPIRFAVDTGDIALGGGLNAMSEVTVAAAEGVADSFTVQRRYFIARKEVDPVAVQGIRIRRPPGVFDLGIKELYLLHGPGASDRWRRVFVLPVMGDAFLNGYENREVAPRALLFAQHRVVGSRNEALEFPHQPSVDARRQVAIELPPGMAPPPASPSQATGDATGEATVTAYEPERIAVRAAVREPGAWLVLSEVVFPGWTAAVDGQDTPIARADGLFRAVWLPSGLHEVVFRYRPRSFFLGVFSSGAAALVVAGLAIAARGRAGLTATAYI